MDFDQTIVAISTAPGVGAIAIVRLSGPKALSITSSIFRSSGQAITKAEFVSHEARHGFVFDNQTAQQIDEVIVTTFANPHSYTGEDVAEISCHGNPVLASRILNLCIKQGARLAQPGEFTRRAFLSGKLDLTQAEAVLDLIQAKTTRGSQAALSALRGDLGRQIELVRNELKQLLTSIVASIDFPDEVEQLDPAQIESVIEQSLIRLQELFNTSRCGKYLREGLKLAIVGRPNAGKSSLLNCLLKVDRAIVTDIPGTTRDTLEEQLEINGIPITLVDTAGMRSTNDLIEKMGIERTKQALGDSHLVLLVADLTHGWQKEEEDILAAIQGTPWLVLWNKADLTANKKQTAPSVKGKTSRGEERSDKPVASLNISAKTGEGINYLTKTIEEWVFTESKPQESAASLNTRQAVLCQNAIGALLHVKTAVVDGLPHDCLTTDLKAALDSLSEISGFSVSEEVITSVFANFCLGK